MSEGDGCCSQCARHAGTTRGLLPAQKRQALMLLAPTGRVSLAAVAAFSKEPLSTLPSLATLSQTVLSQSLLQTAPPASPQPGAQPAVSLLA
jgi:hypothetical protein